MGHTFGSLNVRVLWRYLFFVRPTTRAEAWAYYIAVFRAIFSRALGTASAVSAHLNRSLQIRADGVVFAVRNGTDDLGMAALSADPVAITRFFQPMAGDTVIDVGANVGGYALRAALVANRVIAIEPEPSNYGQLLNNIALNHLSNVTSMQVAISDSVGVGALHLASDSARHSLEESAWGTATGKSVAVRVMTLDQVVASYGIECVNWLKVDVERHELAVLKGAAHCLSITRNLILEFELAQFEVIHAILGRASLEVLWHESDSENSVLIARSSLSL